MSHGITGNDHMISVGATPWHGLGTILENAPETTEQALQLAKLDWTVRTEQMSHELSIANEDGDGEPEKVRTPVAAKVVIREDTGEALGVVGMRWRPVQNVDALRWFDRWIDTGKVRIETAGSLFGGRRVWALARIVSDPIVIKGDDVVNKYVLIAHGHDGTLAVRCGLTMIRVVCNNTLGAAVADGDASGSLFKVSHTSGALDRLGEVADQIEWLDARLSSVGEAYRELAGAFVTGPKAVAEYVAAVYGQDPEDVAKGRRLAKIEDLFARGQGQDLRGSAGTWWGLFNAITEHETHSGGTEQDKRESKASRNVWGSGARTLDRALTVALAMARKTYKAATDVLRLASGDQRDDD